MRLENTTTTRNQSYADIYISTIHSPGESTFSCACARVELSSPHLELIWSNVLQMFKTSVAVSSPPVHQLNCVGNRLPCSMLLSLVCVLPLSHVLQFSGHITAQFLSSARYSDTHPHSLLFMLHHLEGFQSYTCLPSCKKACTWLTWTLGSHHLSTRLTGNIAFSPQSITDSTCKVSHTPLLNICTPGGVLFWSPLLSATTCYKPRPVPVLNLHTSFPRHEPHSKHTCTACSLNHLRTWSNKWASGPLWQRLFFVMVAATVHASNWLWSDADNTWMIHHSNH